MGLLFIVMKIKLILNFNSNFFKYYLLYSYIDLAMQFYEYTFTDEKTKTLK